MFQPLKFLRQRLLGQGQWLIICANSPFARMFRLRKWTIYQKQVLTHVIPAAHQLKPVDFRILPIFRL